MYWLRLSKRKQKNAFNCHHSLIESEKKFKAINTGASMSICFVFTELSRARKTNYKSDTHYVRDKKGLLSKTVEIRSL